MTKTRPYRLWCGIKRRCYNKNDKAYTRYGGAGVKMSKEWKNSFKTFWRDMEDGYFKGAQIDRIDNSKGYSCKSLACINPSLYRKKYILVFFSQ